MIFTLELFCKSISLYFQGQSYQGAADLVSFSNVFEKKRHIIKGVICHCLCLRDCKSNQQTSNWKLIGQLLLKESHDDCSKEMGNKQHSTVLNVVVNQLIYPKLIPLCHSIKSSDFLICSKQIRVIITRACRGVCHFNVNQTLFRSIFGSTV